jgi:hypothetical protein
MNTLAFWLTITAIPAVAGLAVLILLRIGIARQERAGSLASRPRGLSAALTQRILDLHACPPDPADQRRGQDVKRPRTDDRTKSGAS